MKRIIGLMSGTSADGVDVAIVDIQGSSLSTRFQLKAFETVVYSPATRKLILSYLNAKDISVSKISQVNFFLGSLFAEAVLRVCRKHQIALSSVDLIGSHGQTIYHQSARTLFGGRRVASTMQLGEPSMIAEKTGITTVADFRVRDVAAGGTGAPLVPYVDYLLLRHWRRDRVALNIGGIANVTLLPKHCELRKLKAFDTGPGNMMIDAAIAILTQGKMKFDLDGNWASRGKVLSRSLERFLRHPFYGQEPPKAAGREQFGVEYTKHCLPSMVSARREDVLSTLTELTARTIVEAIQQFKPRSMGVDELIVSGGGARNRFLMSRLKKLLPGTEVMTSSEVGIDVDAKEAIAFAILANETWHHQPSNVPSVTGARHPVILGKIVVA